MVGYSEISAIGLTGTELDALKEPQQVTGPLYARKSLALSLKAPCRG